MKTLNYFYVVLISFLLISSCTKESEIEPEYQLEKLVLVKKITSVSSDNSIEDVVWEYNYNNLGNPIEFFVNGVSNYTVEYTDTKISKLIGTNTEQTVAEFIYENNLLKEIKGSRNNTPVLNVTFTYDAQNKIIKYEYFDLTFNEYELIEFTYSSAKNMTEYIRYSGESSNNYTKHFTRKFLSYDTKNSMLTYLDENLKKYMLANANTISLNNCLTSEISYSWVAETIIINHVYEYNAHDFPIKIEDVDQAGNVKTTHTIHYEILEL